MGIKWHRRGLFSAVVLLATTSCLGQDPIDSVRRRLLEIKGEDENIAQNAELELMSLGDNALEPLRKIINDPKDSERGEASRVYPWILAKTGRLTQVTLDFQDAKLSDVVAELNKQCKVATIEAGSMGNTRITLARGKIPYALALAEICRLVDANLSVDYSSRKLRFRKEAGSLNRPVSEDWGNVVFLDSIRLRTALRYEGEKRTSSTLDLNLKLMLDPTARLLWTEGYTDLQGTDESGRAFSPVQNNMGEPMSDMSMSMIYDRTLMLSTPGGARKIASLKGKMAGAVGYDYETWTTDGLKPGDKASHEFGKLKMDVYLASHTGTNLTLRVAFTGVPKPREDIRYGIDHSIHTLITGSLKVESPDGKNPWTTRSTTLRNLDRQENNEFTGGDYMIAMDNLSGKSGSPVKVTLSLPRRIEKLLVGFEFKNVDLY